MFVVAGSSHCCMQAVQLQDCAPDLHDTAESTNGLSRSFKLPQIALHPNFLCNQLIQEV